MAIPGTVPVTGPVAPTSTGDTYPATLEEYQEGGFRSVADNTERDAISVPRRKAGMLVWVESSGITYQLDPDLVTWNTYNNGVSPSDVMLKSVYDPNDDGIVTNAAQLNSQLPAFYLSRANHTGTQAIATVSGLQAALDAKEDETNKGIANGYAPLNSSVKIDNAYLDFPVPLNYAGVWNANTNSPALADGVGAASDAYIVSVAGTQNLGSGAIVFAVGDIVVYDGAIWQKVPSAAVGVSQITTQSGTFTGAVSLLTTAHFANSTNKNMVSDLILAGLNAANSPSGTNAIATMDDVASAIVVGNTFITPETYSNGETLGAGTSVTLTSLGYTNGSAAAVWTRVDSAYTIDVNTMTIDWITNQEMWETAKFAGVSTCYLTPGRCYVPNQSIDLPGNMASWSGSGNRRSNRFALDLAGSCIRNLSGTNFAVLNRYPANQAEADAWVTTSFDIRNGAIFGRNTSNAADICIKIGAHSNSEWRNLHLESAGMCVLNEFCLTSSFYSVDVQGFGTYGFANRSGTWSGAGSSNAQCNANKFFNLKTYNNSGKTPTAAWYQLGGYGSQLIGSVFEGASGSQHHVYYEMTADQVAQLLIMDGFQFETAGVTRAGIKIKGYKGSAVFRNWQNIIPAADMAVLFECETVAGQLGAPTMYIQNGPDTWDPGANEGLLRSVNNNSTLPSDTSQPWEPRWEVHTTQLPNNTTLNTAANFNTGVANSFVPQSAHCRFTPLLG